MNFDLPENFQPTWRFVEPELGSVSKQAVDGVGNLEDAVREMRDKGESHR